jgi:hypothetical protein
MPDEEFDDYVRERFFGQSANLKGYTSDPRNREPFVDLLKKEVKSFVARTYDDPNSKECLEGVEFWETLLTPKENGECPVGDMLTNFVRSMFRKGFERQHGRPPVDGESYL